MERVKRSGAGILRFRPPNRLPRPPIFRRYFFFLFFFHLPSSPPRVSPAVSSCTLEKTERFERIRRMTCDFRVSPQPDRLPTDLSHRSATRSIRRGSIDPSRESKRACGPRFDAVARPSRGNELIIARAHGTVLYLRYIICAYMYDASCLSPANTRLSEQYVITNKPCNRPLISSPSCAAISLPEMHFLY